MKTKTGEPPTEKLIPVSHMKNRGWTLELIRLFLGDPDEERANPHYLSGPPMKLYKLQRIEKVEKSAKFRRAQDDRRGRREGAQRGVETKKQRTAEYVENVEIIVPRMDQAELINRACDNYNLLERSGANCADQTSPPEFIERICVNYLRHRLTSYEDNLRKICGKVGARDAYLAIKEKVLYAISDEYDWLSEECNRQVSKMWRDEDLRMPG